MEYTKYFLFAKIKTRTSVGVLKAQPQEIDADGDKACGSTNPCAFRRACNSEPYGK